MSNTGNIHYINSFIRTLCAPRWALTVHTFYDALFSSDCFLPVYWGGFGCVWVDRRWAEFHLQPERLQVEEIHFVWAGVHRQHGLRWWEHAADGQSWLFWGEIVYFTHFQPVWFPRIIVDFDFYFSLSTFFFPDCKILWLFSELHASVQVQQRWNHDLLSRHNFFWQLQRWVTPHFLQISLPVLYSFFTIR